MRTKPNDPARLARSAPSKGRRGSSRGDRGGPEAPVERGDDEAAESHERHESERTCILSRRKARREELIRLALSPEGDVAPDVRARAPGRGAWVGVTRAELDQANEKGKLKPALQRAFKLSQVRVPADLGELTETALRKAALDRLGLESRAGHLLYGTDRIENAARSGKVHLLIHAADAADDGRRSLDQSWRVGGGGPEGVIFPEGRTILSLALGRENVVHIALTDPAAASRVHHALARWRAFTGPMSGPEGGEPAFGTCSAEED